MQRARRVVGGTVALVLLVVLVTGPLVGAVDLTRERDPTAGLGQGNATVTVESMPERATLAQGDYGADSYYLRVPAAAVRLSNVSERPLLAYAIDVPNLSYSRTTSHFVSDQSEGRFEVTLQEDTIVASKVQQSSYAAQLRLILRGDAERTIATRNVTVEVRG